MMQDVRTIFKSRGKMNLCMCGLNILVFLVMSSMGVTGNSISMLNHGAMLSRWVVEKGEYYRLVTSMFLHFSVEHLAYNMFCLFITGDILEKRVGSIRYLIIYFGGGIIGNLVCLIQELRSGADVVSAGASGAVFAVIGALVWLVISNLNVLKPEFVLRVLIAVAIMLASGFSEEGVSGTAHMGGFIGGLVICILLNLLYIARDNQIRKKLRK